MDFDAPKTIERKGIKMKKTDNQNYENDNNQKQNNFSVYAQCTLPEVDDNVACSCDAIDAADALVVVAHRTATCVRGGRERERER